MANQILWKSVCIFCGKSNPAGQRRLDYSGAPSMNPPMPSGKCVSSPDGKHHPRWERMD